MKTEKCPCGSGKEFSACCGELLSGQREARTAEELMRSRYTAYVRKDVDYLVRTTHPASLTPKLAEEIQSWMDQVVVWMGLHVLSSSQGAEGDTTGKVEFVAEYSVAGGANKLHERSIFKKVDGKWCYLKADFISE